MVSPNPFQSLTPLTEQNVSQLAEFDCEDEGINEFLRRFALAEQDHRLNRTYLGLDGQTMACACFVTVSAAQVARELTAIPRRRLPYPVAPALFIGRLGVDRQFKRRGLARALVRWARWIAFIMPIGCRFVALQVEESNLAAISLYRSEGFWVPQNYETQGGLLLMLYDLATARPAN